MHFSLERMRLCVICISCRRELGLEARVIMNAVLGLKGLIMGPSFEFMFVYVVMML